MGERPGMKDPEPNKRPALDAEIARLFAIERHCPGLPEPARWATRGSAAK
jgi:hypothetical protein